MLRTLQFLASSIFLFSLVGISTGVAKSAPSDEHTKAALKRAVKKELEKQGPAATAHDQEELHAQPVPAKVESHDIAVDAGHDHDDTDKHDHHTPKAPMAVPAAPIKPASAHTNSHAATPSVPAEKSLGWLKNGNIRYIKKNLRADGRSQQDRERLTSGQRPHAIVLSCADSRVPPETIFDQALGEIFVIRVAGEALDSSVIASIEYAVEHLGPELLVVMGHTQCDAVKAALDSKEGTSVGSEALDKLVGDIKPRLRTIANEPRSKNLEVESTLNADGVARDLVKRSEIIRSKVESGELKIKPALYRLDSGKVTFY